MENNNEINEEKMDIQTKILLAIIAIFFLAQVLPSIINMGFKG